MTEHAVLAVDRLIDGRGWPVRVAGLAIALFKVGDHVYALENVCRHTGAPLDGGAARHGVVTCPWHGWTYALHTGALVTMFGDRPGVRSFPARIDDGWVKVAVPDEVGDSAT